MVKKNIITGIGINMASISTDSSFPLGENYCVDVKKECKDLGAITDLPVYDRGSPGASKTDAEIIDKKFLLTPEWMKKNNPEESLYFKKFINDSNFYISYVPSNPQYAESYFPETSDHISRKGWDHFGNETTLKYIPVQDPALKITTKQEDLLIGYRDKLYNFLFECNQYNYNLEWSLVNPSAGCIMNPNGYFSLSETGAKSESYTFTVKVYNPDTLETATENFVLTTGHSEFIPEALNIPLEIRGSSTISISPHRSFKSIYEAVGGSPPYRFAINSPLKTQWPFQDNTRRTLHGKEEVMQLQFLLNYNSLYKDNFDSSDVGYFVLGRKIIFEKIPFKPNPNATIPPPNPLIELAALPGGLVFNTTYYCIPLMEGADWTGYVQFASTYDDAIDGNFIAFTSEGAGATSQVFYYYFPGNPDLVDFGTTIEQTYIKTINRYIKHVAINIAIPPLPKQWGHANRYDTHSTLEEGDPWYPVINTSHIHGRITGNNHYKPIEYTYNTTEEKYEWSGSTNIYAWISDDADDVKEPAFLDYTLPNRFLGQCLKALGFEDYPSTTIPFDPWRYESLTKTATNYFDVTVIDNENESATLRVIIEDPDYDFSNTCKVPYWEAQINYYSCNTPTPMTTKPRTTGKTITAIDGKYVVKNYIPDYDPDDPDLEYNDVFSKTVPALDKVDKFTFKMKHYFPASRFTEYKSFTKYSLTNESTYWPYEKFTLPLNKMPFSEMSIHPIYYFSHGLYYEDYYDHYTVPYNIYNLRKY